jgi:hypothetical protein
MQDFRSMVLLTTGAPRLPVEAVQRRLSRWTGRHFLRAHEARPSFAVGAAEVYKVSPSPRFPMSVTLLPGCYWACEPIEPYARYLRRRGSEAEVARMAETHGALIVVSHATAAPARAAMYLAKLTAALMDGDTPFVLVPPAGKARRISKTLRSRLGRARGPDAVVGDLISVRTVAGPVSGHVVCVSRGVEMFGLPEIALPARPGEAKAAGSAIKWAAAAQVQAGRRLERGQAFLHPVFGTLRVVPTLFHRHIRLSNAVCLAPLDAERVEPRAQRRVS